MATADTDSDSNGTDSQSPGREVAQRVFATEFTDGVYTFQESDDDRSPVYQLLPTGKPANRVFIVGTVTEINFVGDDGNTVEARIVDPTGSVFTYAGQYQPDCESSLRDMEVPAYVALIGKPRTFSPDDSQEVYVSVRPEHVVEVDESVRDDWVEDTAKHTIDRISNMDQESNPYARMADEQYEIDPAKYLDEVITVLEEELDAGDSEGDQLGATGNQDSTAGSESESSTDQTS